jgi:ubiquitin fusion degradation protein 1
MSFNLTAYGLIFSEHALMTDLENSNKTLLPAACIPDLDLDAGITYLEVSSDTNDKKVVCAVHEHTETPGIIFMPSRIMNAMGIDACDNVKVVQKTDIQKGEYIKIRPFQKAFIELSNPKAVLERHISQFYPVLTKGEVINILYNDVDYQIEIVETKPSSSIQTTNCDINLDFDRPVDMEDESKNETRQEMKQENKIIRKRTVPHEYQNKRSKEDMRRFPGKGYRLGSS